MTRNLSFREISEANHESLLAYLERLRAAGLKLPSRGGVVNKAAVARACGFARETFQQNPRFAATLSAAVLDLGLESPDAAMSAMPPPSERPERNSEDKARIMQLEQQLAACRGEALELRRRLRRYEAIAEHVGSTGRRVIP